MKKFFLVVSAAALFAGCAHEGGMGDRSYRDTGYNRSEDEYGPARPSPLDREFPGRVGPGSDRIDPALPR